MTEYGLITGSGFYDFGLDKKTKIVSTEYGKVSIDFISINGKEVAHISRHGKNHEILSSMVNHKANIMAMSKIGVKLIISTTVCGIVNEKLELGKLLLFDDLFFLDNRLPNGELCTFFTKVGGSRGHYIFSNPFNEEILNKINADSKVTYGHVNGPRFNSKSEIKFIKNYADAISQTCGPEAILSGELKISYVLLGFGVDYANGVKPKPTPMEELQKNMGNSKTIFKEAIEKILSSNLPKFQGFVYRFDKKDV